MIRTKFKAGFTLFEVLISVGIIVVLSAVVLYNHQKFNTDIEITNLAYKMALGVREAQVYSISVKQSVRTAGERFDVPYGLHFSRDFPASYVFFADGADGGDGIYTTERGEDAGCDPISDSECVEKVTIGRGNLIKGWCGIWGNVSQKCSFIEPHGPDYLDINFKRPDPDAIFRVYEEDEYALRKEVKKACWNQPNQSGSAVACTGWAICLISPQGREKRVVVYETGQISVENVISGSSDICATP